MSEQICVSSAVCNLWLLCDVGYCLYNNLQTYFFFCVYNNNKRKPNTVSVSVWVKNKNVCKLNILYYKYFFVLLIPAHDRAVILWADTHEQQDEWSRTNDRHRDELFGSQCQQFMLEELLSNISPSLLKTRSRPRRKEETCCFVHRRKEYYNNSQSSRKCRGGTLWGFLFFFSPQSNCSLSNCNEIKCRSTPLV